MVTTLLWILGGSVVAVLAMTLYVIAKSGGIADWNSALEKCESCKYFIEKTQDKERRIALTVGICQKKFKDASILKRRKTERMKSEKIQNNRFSGQLFHG